VIGSVQGEAIMSSVWVFVAAGGRLPSGVFKDRSLAKDWIKKHNLSGLLTEYPVDIGIYDWAAAEGFFKAKYPSHNTPEFIGRFTSAYLRHSHFENGEESSSTSC
jgi:hypothetical protein